jgi:RNA polymerase sigma factor (sigma-70 family)
MEPGFFVGHIVQPLTDEQRQLAEQHFRLVWAVANRLWKRLPGLRQLGWDLYDVIQTGSIGLFEAAAQYRPDRGMKFSSFAWRMIAWEIQAVAARRVVRRFRRLDPSKMTREQKFDPGKESNLRRVLAGMETLSADEARIVDLCFGSPEPLEVLARRQRLNLPFLLIRRDVILNRFRSGIPWA